LADDSRDVERRREFYLSKAAVAAASAERASDASARLAWFQLARSWSNLAEHIEQNCQP
jgi:hypothetical protein